MKKQFELNGVNVELSKEQLQEMLKDFDKPVGSIGKDECGYIVLRKNNDLVSYLGGPKATYQDNISQLTIRIAEEMGYLATEEQIKDTDKAAKDISFCLYEKSVYVTTGQSAPNHKIIDTHVHAEEIIELIKSSEYLLKYIGMENE